MIKLDMCSVTHLFKHAKGVDLLKVPVRYKHPKTHWSVLKKKRTPKDKALEHFDDLYATVYGNAWPSIRKALLKEETKYVAVINNYSDTTRIKTTLESLGAMNLKSVYESCKLDLVELAKRKGREEPKTSHETEYDIDSKISEVHSSKLQSAFPKDYEVPLESLDSSDVTEDTKAGSSKSFEPWVLKSIDPNLNEVQLATDRIVNPDNDLSGLHEYVPATKIKGMDEYVLESEYFSHYKKAADFSVKVEQEYELSFPKYLDVYAFENDNDSRFPAPQKGSTEVSDYFLFDGGSILPVLALDVQPGDSVLDMCAAPGGKALAILQTLCPRLLVVNDVMQSRVNRINNILSEYVANMEQWDRKLFVTQQDARRIEEADIFNKILVDVPCSTDRHNLHCEDNNIFKPSRVRERLQLPQLQTEILFNALKLVCMGGTVVYSTCSLSPIENHGVVQMALKRIWEETNTVMVVKDMSAALKPLKYLYKFGNFGFKYGHIVIPTVQNNWGPMYFCKIERVQ